MYSAPHWAVTYSVKERSELHRSVPIDELVKAVDRAGNRDGESPLAGDDRLTLLAFVRALPIGLNVRSLGGTAAPVERLVLPVEVGEREHVAADAGHVRLDEVQHRGRRDRGVPALAKRLDADLCGQRMASRDHAVSRHHG